jgi:hypothetical protein
MPEAQIYTLCHICCSPPRWVPSKGQRRAGASCNAAWVRATDGRCATAARAEVGTGSRPRHGGRPICSAAVGEKRGPTISACHEKLATTRSNWCFHLQRHTLSSLRTPDTNWALAKFEFTTLCCFATNASDEVHERGAEAAVRLNRHGHGGIAGIFPAPILGDLGGVAVCCCTTRALCGRPPIGRTTRMDD